MRQKLPFIAGILAFAVALAYVLTAGLIQPIQAYGTGTQAPANPVRAINTIRDTLTNNLTKQGYVQTQNSAAAATQENYLLGTSTCRSTNLGTYGIYVELTSTTKTPLATISDATNNLPTNINGYTPNITHAGSRNNTQITLINNNHKPVAVITLTYANPTNTQRVIIGGNTTNCYPLSNLPRTTAKDTNQ